MGARWRAPSFIREFGSLSEEVTFGRVLRKGVGRTACAGRGPWGGQEQPCPRCLRMGKVAEAWEEGGGAGRPGVREELGFYPDIQHQEGQGDRGKKLRTWRDYW